MGLGYALNCVLRMLEIFSRGHEPGVEGDDSLVVDAVEKQEAAGNAVYGRAAEGLLRREKDVFIRLL